MRTHALSIVVGVILAFVAYFAAAALIPHVGGWAFALAVAVGLVGFLITRALQAPSDADGRGQVQAKIPVVASTPEPRQRDTHGPDISIAAVGPKGSGKTVYLTVALDLLRAASPPLWRSKPDTATTRRLGRAIKGIQTGTWPTSGPDDDVYRGSFIGPHGARTFEITELDLDGDDTAGFQEERFLRCLAQAHIIYFVLDAGLWTPSTNGSLSPIITTFLSLLHRAEPDSSSGGNSGRPLGIIITRKETLAATGVDLDQVGSRLIPLRAQCELAYRNFGIFRVAAIGDAVQPGNVPTGFQPEDVDLPICWALDALEDSRLPRP